MSDRQKAPAGGIGQAIPYVISGILVASFLFRVLTAAHEYPMRTEQVMTMLIDLGLSARIAEYKLVAIGCCLCHAGRSDHAARTADVLNHDLPTQNLGKAEREDASRGISRPSGGSCFHFASTTQQTCSPCQMVTSGQSRISVCPVTGSLAA